MNEKKPDRSPWAVFALSFSISLAALLILVMVVLSLTVSPRQAQQEQVTEAFQYQPGIKESINVLFISCRQRSDAPFAYTLVRFDAVGERLILIPIPPDTVTTVGAKTGSFRKHYDYAGSANARLAAESLFLCDVDRYVRVAKSGAVNLIDAGEPPVERRAALRDRRQPAGGRSLGGMAGRDVPGALRPAVPAGAGQAAGLPLGGFLEQHGHRPFPV